MNNLKDNKVLVAVPSKNRAGIFQTFTFNWLQYSQLDWRVFVEPQDLEPYSGITDKIAVLKDNDQGLGYSKESIYQYAKDNGYDFIFKLDDDIKSWSRFREVIKEPQEIAKFFDEQVDYMVTSGFRVLPQLKAFAFPYSFEMYEQRGFKLTNRLQTAYLTRVESFYADRRFSVFEDFYTGLMIRLNSGFILRHSQMGIALGVPVGAGEGGHQTPSQQRIKRAEQELTELCKISPAVKIRKNKGKSWIYEPTINTRYVNK